ncbi:MAG: hypothetical protein HDR84_01115 [Bacteroides sp.]|nr:hypothetical protein [Bacteroides sp.]
MSNSKKYHMKKFFLIAVSSLSVLAASAEIKFKSLDNIKGTNVVLVDDNAPQTVKITDAVLSNNGSEYPAKQIRCDVVDGVATYKLKFKRLTLFKDCEVTLTVNGEKITINLQKNMVDGKVATQPLNFR